MINKELSIIITAYRKVELLELCINSIRKNIDNKINYEIIVADSDTNESTMDLMKEKFSDVTFIPNKKNVGFGRVANQGIARAKGEYLFIINHDIIIKDEAIQKLLIFLKDNKDVGLVAPRLINFDGKVQLSAFKFYRPLTILFRRTFLKNTSFGKKYLNKFLLKDKIFKNKVIDVDWVMGSAMMVSRESIDKVGVFDNKFFMYFEDVDWCRRFWENGYRVVYNPTVTIAHYHGKASENKGVLQAVLLNKYTRIHIKSAMIYFWKYFGKKDPHRAYYNKVNIK